MHDLAQALRTRVGEFISLRHDIHQHPELAFQEHRTAALVADKLLGWGYEVHRGVGGTGVVGTLVRGNGRGRLGIRADMDALPMAEATGLPHASRHAGVMHACGHDGHTAMPLAAARHLAEHGRFSGTVHLIFQPAEEGEGGSLLGAGQVTLQGPPLTGSEDFAFMLQQVTGSYVLFGNGTAASGHPGGACMVHHPGYDFNDANIAVGSAYWVLLAESFLPLVAGANPAHASVRQPEGVTS